MMSSTDKSSTSKQIKLGNNLRKCRFEHNEISQQELANALGVTRLTTHSIEAGKFNPSVSLALKIAKFFNKTVEEIFYLYEE
jgi:putative transcriptional regulator